MQLPQWLARFNRHVTNPIQRLWAGWAPTMGILEHVGRRSGRPYRTPLTVFPTRDGVAILLTYGPDRDWLKNLSAAGAGRVTRYGRTFGVRDPRVVPKREAATSVTGWMRPLFAVLPFDQALLLTRAE
ncbi:nitroreductase family deazaflavin-dependent oxidoreductase [Mycobacterium sp. IDR2000157661]|uniref:nitroreductase family deazaflavin-dependent oxidoreductase n=1 Tax=Mycobacterium sp. IDR2000157661 TaxID=2867005 RepID=UPI001EEACF14|nr:nitroreductase family deazaflavin-dependent oxidoreductase [Mycobacterium sp. IDR2000157661]ULE34184.1 nitroreductase family deazaflavin-dependent oxidoreductase [Mycobacterium sp. IDR2000157661]